MSRTVIIPTRNVVLIDGKPHDVDCSALDQTIHVIELGAKRGIIEYINDRDAGPDEFRANAVIDDFAPYQPLIDAWQAAEDNPQPPQPPQPPQRDPPKVPPEIQAMIDRSNALLSDTDRKVLVSKIKTATPAQIKAYIGTNVTDLASAKVLLTQLVLIVAAIIQGEPDR